MMRADGLEEIGELEKLRGLLPHQDKPPFDFESYHRNLVIGAPNSGKSVLVELIAELAKKNGFMVIDLFDSGSGENLFWCVQGKDQTYRENDYAKPVMIKGTRHKVLIIAPRYCEIEGAGGSNAYVEYVSDDTPVVEMVRKAHDEGRILTLGHMLYKRSLGESHKVFAKIMNELPELNRDKFKMNVMYVIREAALVAFSQIRLYTEHESLSRRAMIGFSKISRHYRSAFVQDTQLLQDVHSSITALQDRLLIKFSTERMIPDGYHWIWEKVQKQRKALLETLNYSPLSKKLAGYFYPDINLLKPWEFYAVYPDDSIVLFRNPMPRFWHKRPEDDWGEMAGVKIHYIESKTPTEMGQHGIRMLQEKNRTERMHFLQQIVGKILASGVKSPHWSDVLTEFNSICDKEGKPQLKFRSVGSAKVFYGTWAKPQETSNS